MKNFFISDDDILKVDSSLEKSSLSANFQSYTPFFIDGIKGVLLSEEDFENFIEEFNAKIESRSDTLYEGIISIRLSVNTIDFDQERIVPLDRKSEVVVSPWGRIDSVNPGPFKEILEIMLAPYLCIDIKLMDLMNNVSGVSNDSYFFVKIWSGLSGENRINVPGKIWDIAIPDNINKSTFGFSGNGIPIKDSSSNHIVAELLDNNLYIFHDALGDGSSNSIDIFRRIISEVLLIFGVFPEEIKEKYTEALERYTTLSCEKYINLCCQGIEKQREKAEEEISDIDDSIAALQKELVELIRDRQERQNIKDRIVVDDSIRIRFENEYNKLLKTYKVKRVELENSSIRIYTNPLVAVNPETGKKHLIGRMLISIFTDGSEKCIKWFNLDRRGADNHHAPHVNSGGEACFGNTAEIWPELIANYEFATCAMLAIQFAESVNIDDAWGKKVNSFPLLKDGDEIDDTKMVSKKPNLGFIDGFKRRNKMKKCKYLITTKN